MHKKSKESLSDQLEQYEYYLNKIHPWKLY